MKRHQITSRTRLIGTERCSTANSMKSATDHAHLEIRTHTNKIRALRDVALQCHSHSLTHNAHISEERVGASRDRENNYRLNV